MAHEACAHAQEKLGYIDRPVLPLPAPQTERGVRLFKFVRQGSAGSWAAASANASPRFYDAKEDAGGKGHDW